MCSSIGNQTIHPLVAVLDQSNLTLSTMSGLFHPLYWVDLRKSSVGVKELRYLLDCSTAVDSGSMVDISGSS